MLGILVGFWYDPVQYQRDRITIIYLAMAAWAGAIFLAWPRPRLRGGIAAVSAAAVIFMCLPGRPEVPGRIRTEYVRALSAYEGTTYIWGGEGTRGIDCSGLVRRALADALVLRGVKSANPSLIREGGRVWWNDATARMLKEESRGWTRRVFEAPSLNEADLAPLLPGDLAATADGRHIMAYLGNNEWIEADPGAGRVIRVRAPSSENRWFQVPIVLLRWDWPRFTGTPESF